MQSPGGACLGFMGVPLYRSVLPALRTGFLLSMQSSYHLQSVLSDLSGHGLEGHKGLGWSHIILLDWPLVHAFFTDIVFCLLCLQGLEQGCLSLLYLHMVLFSNQILEQTPLAGSMAMTITMVIGV